MKTIPTSAFKLKTQLPAAFPARKRLGLTMDGAFFNADHALATLDAGQVCFHQRLIPNISQNKRHRKPAKRGRNRLFDTPVYQPRFTSERRLAGMDKFRALLVRFDRQAAPFLAAHHLVFALINLRHLFAAKP